MQKIIPHLWFDTQAKEAAEFYSTVFPDSKVESVTEIKDTPSGDSQIVSFTVAGYSFMAISAGPLFKFNPSVSFHVKCKTADEVDAIWAKLSPGGKVMMELGKYPFSERYGWVQDKYGVSWQIIAGNGEFKQRVTPVLMFTGAVCGKTEEAVAHYVDIFKNSPFAKGPADAKVAARYAKGEEPDTEGTVKYEWFMLEGQEFGAMDSARNHDFTFGEAISFMVSCDTQEEIDYYWDKLTAGGDPKAQQCGWLKDKYGLSWQVVPAMMGRLMGGDEATRARVTQAFLKMKKFDIAELERAAQGN